MLGAAKDVLDRGGLKAADRVEVAAAITVKRPGELPPLSGPQEVLTARFEFVHRPFFFSSRLDCFSPTPRITRQSVNRGRPAFIDSLTL